MKIMKRLFLSLAILACVSLTMSINAQNGKKDRKDRFALSKELNLSADQKNKIEQVNTDFKAKATELRAKTDLTKDAHQSQMEEIKQEHRKAISNILTADQQAQLDKKGLHRKNMDKSMYKGKRGQPMHRHLGMNRVKDLNLSDDQKQKIEAVNKDYRAKMKNMSNERKEALNKIYTPEQQAKVKEFNKNKRFKGQNRLRGNLDEATIAKLKTLRENFVKEKKAIELSRIAPDAQKQKIKDIRENFRKEKQQILKDARKG